MVQDGKVRIRDEHPGSAPLTVTMKYVTFRENLICDFFNKELTEIFTGDASDAAVSNVSQLPQRLVHEYSAHRHRILADVSRPSKKIHDYNFSSFPIFQR
jgi:hypothetical protein